MIRINNINKGRKSFKIKPLSRVQQILKEEKGASIITYIIFVAFLILALLLIQPDVKEVFSNTAATFKTWIAGKIASILS